MKKHLNPRIAHKAKVELRKPLLASREKMSATSRTRREQHTRGKEARARINVPVISFFFFFPLLSKKNTWSQVRIKGTGENFTSKFGAFRSVTEVIKYPDLFLRIALGIIIKLVIMKLLHRLEGINKEFAGHATRSNYWHAQLLRAQVKLRSSCHPLFPPRTVINTI